MANTHQSQARLLCQEWGLRATKTRLLLFEFLLLSGKPVSIREILDWAEQHQVVPDKTTLYREIERLVAQGIVRPVQLATRVVSYELASHGHHHHFVCTSCDYVMDVVFPETAIEKTEQALAKEGVIVERHSLEFFGLCKTCN